MSSFPALAPFALTAAETHQVVSRLRAIVGAEPSAREIDKATAAIQATSLAYDFADLLDRARDVAARRDDDPDTEVGRWLVEALAPMAPLLDQFLRRLGTREAAAARAAAALSMTEEGAA